MKLKVANGAYSLTTNTKIKICEAQIILCVDNNEISCLENAKQNDSSFSYKANVYDGRLNIYTEFQVSDKLLVTVKIENISDEPVKINRCYSLKSKMDMGCSIDDINIMCRNGFYNNNIRPLAADTNPLNYGYAYTGESCTQYEPGKHRSVISSNIYNKTDKEYLNISFLTFDRIDSIIYYYIENDNPQVECYCDFQDYELQPNRLISSETLRIASSYDFDDCMKGWASDVSAHYKPRFIPKPALGALGSGAWTNGVTHGIMYEELVRKNIKAISERLKSFGVEYYWVSIANLKDNLPGNWLANNDKQIPGGLKALSDTLNQYGMKLGLWMAPFWIPDRNSDQAEKQANQILKLDGEKCKERKSWNHGMDILPIEKRADFYCRDGSNPDAQAYIREIFKAYREIGVRYYMVDFLWAGAGGLYGPFKYNEYYDKTKVTGPEVYRELMKVVREATGEDTYLLVSTAPMLINVGLVDAVRTGPDIGEGRAAKKGHDFYPATYALGNWKMFKKACNNYAHAYHIHGKLFHADSFNVITIDKPIPLSEAQISVSMAALASSAMMLGDRIAELSDDRLKLLKKALPQNVGEAAVSIDLFECEYPEIPGMYHLKVNRKWGSYSVIGLLNLNNDDRWFELDLRKLGYTEDCIIYDFWDEKFMGVFKNDVCIKQCIQPHSIKVLRIAQYEERPQLLSTDMHVLQGAVEVLNVFWRNKELVISCKRPLGEKGVVSMLVPDRFVPSDYDGIHTGLIHGTNHYIISKELYFDIETKTFRVKFIEE